MDEDENDQAAHSTPDGPTGEEHSEPDQPAGDTEQTSHAGEPEDPDTEAGTGAGSDSRDRATSPPAGRLVLSQRNLQVVGRLVLHYAERTISLAMDGDAALRALWQVRHGTAGGVDLTDRVDPVNGSAEDVWLLFHTDGLLAAEWQPGLSPTGRSAPITVDPAA